MTKLLSLVAVSLLMLTCISARSQRLHSIQVENLRLDSVMKILHTLDTNYIPVLTETPIHTFVDLSMQHATMIMILDKLFSNIPYKYELIFLAKSHKTEILVTKRQVKPFYGTIVNLNNLPVENIHVRVKGTGTDVLSDEQGNFELKHVPGDAFLVISGLNIPTDTIAVRGRSKMDIIVDIQPTTLAEATVTNGKDELPVGKLPLSLYKTKADFTYNFSSPDIMDHINKYSPGLLAGTPRGPSSGLTFGGWNSLFFQHDPVAVWDKFDYPGLISDINPYDAPGVTLLDDVASENIWEVRSANGVLVFTSRAGHYRQPARWTVNINTTLLQKPDLSGLRWMSPSDYIDFERRTYASGFFDNYFYNPSFPVTPALTLMRQMDSNKVSRTMGEMRLNQMAAHHTIADLNKYYYHSSFVRQIHAAVNGGNAGQKYYASLGYDYSPTDLTRNSYQRITAHVNYTAHPFTPKIETMLILSATSLETHDNNSGTSPVAYTYAQMKGDDGKPAVVPFGYNPAYIDTVGQGSLYPWTYRPLTELALSDQQTNRYVGHIQGGVTWRPVKGLSAAVYGQLFRGWTFNKQLYDKQSWYVRDLANQFAQNPGASTIWPIPYGNILSETDTMFKAYNVRTEIKYKHYGDGGRQWAAYAGFEASDRSTSGTAHQIYNYGQGSPEPVDFSSFFTTRPGGYQQIPGAEAVLSEDERYASVFGNVYAIWDRFSLYGSGRMDASNFMNIPNSSRWTPFWAGGVSYRLLDTARFAPKLQLSAAFGCNGNISNRVSALTVVQQGTNSSGNPQVGIASLPDFAPQWEKVYRLDLCFDFGFLRDVHEEQGHLQGRLGFYYKIADRLLGKDSLPLSAGYTEMMRTDGGITGQGVSLRLTSVVASASLRWENTFLFNWYRDRVCRYGFMPLSPANIVSGAYPVKGHSPAALFSYRNAPLDHTTGDPQGWYNGKMSSDYNTLTTDSASKPRDEGSAVPTIYGSTWSDWRYKNWQLSIGIGFKAGYRIRRPSVNYSALLLESSHGDIDYRNRWMKPGDEAVTNIPSLPSVLNTSRDDFFDNSHVLTVDGSLVRLQDVRLAYAVVPKEEKKPLIREAIFSVGVSNLLLLWKANNAHIDPDAAAGIPLPRAWTIGCRLSL